MRTRLFDISYDVLEAKDPQNVVHISVQPAASTYFQKGAFLQLVAGNVNQVQPVPSGVTGTPVGICPRDFTTDASSNITFGTPATGGNEHGATFQSFAMMVNGTFSTADLVQTGAGQIRSAYVGDTSGSLRLNTIGRLIVGTTSQGVVKIN
jgi:hypothetical protein